MGDGSTTQRLTPGNVLIAPVVRDFNGGGKGDILWRNSSAGATALWLMNGLSPLSSAFLLSDPSWAVTHVGDFNGDGKADLVWRNSVTGETALWLMNGTVAIDGAIILYDGSWAVTHVGDFNGDGKTDLVWRNSTTGQTAIWLMNWLAALDSTVILGDANWVDHARGRHQWRRQGRSRLAQQRNGTYGNLVDERFGPICGRGGSR